MKRNTMILMIILLNTSCNGLSGIDTKNTPVKNETKDVNYNTETKVISKTPDPTSTSSENITSLVSTKRVFSDNKNFYINNPYYKINIEKISDFNGSIVNTKINKNGDGFITFYSIPGAVLDLVDPFFGRTQKVKIKYALVKNFKAVSDYVEDDFDAISIDENGNGIVYSYLRAKFDIDPQLKSGSRFTNFRNEISYREVKNYNISSEKKIIETIRYSGAEYTPYHLVLSPTGNGMILDIKYENQKQILMVRKVVNFIPENIADKILEIDSETALQILPHPHHISVYRDILDNLNDKGNGYIKYETRDNKTGLIFIKNYIIEPQSSVIIDTEFYSYPDKLDENGDGEFYYLKYSQVENSRDLVFSIIKNYKVISKKIIKYFPNGKSRSDVNVEINFCTIKNGNGFIIWREIDLNKNETVTYIQDINNYKLI